MSDTDRYRLLLVRHGETGYNHAGRIQGQLDIPLNATGIAQARAIGQHLASFPIIRCYTSDLARAVDTAREIATHHRIRVEPVPELREAHLGVLQGRLIRDVEATLADDAAYLLRQDAHARPTGGESPMEVRKRCQRFARRLTRALTRLPSGAVVIVGHGGSLRALTAVLLRLPASAGWSFRFDNGSLTEIEWRPNRRPLLVTYNDRCHLAG
jgi:broad specificity phosphatase PhoE